MNVLNLSNDLYFDDTITKYQYHTYQPRIANYGNNDEVRICIQHQDICTLPSESYIVISGKVEKVDAADTQFLLIKNAFAFLFEEIRYELNGVEVDKVRDVGIASTIKGLLSISSNNQSTLDLAGWGDTGNIKTFFEKDNDRFFAHIPLKFFMGFAEDYKKVVLNARQELILLRSATDVNCYIGTPGAKVNIEKIEWRVPHLDVSDEIKLKMMERLRIDQPFIMAFRKWELHELPSLRRTDKDVWAVKTSVNLEKPRYVVVAFHEDRKGKEGKDASQFDHCNVKNIKIHLNSESYPYDNMNLNIENGNYLLAYDMYARFQKSYYNRADHEVDAILSFENFKNHFLYVFDVSKQNESIKNGTVDLKIEMEATKSFKENTRAYCLILCDSIVEYTPLTGTVRKIA